MAKVVAILGSYRRGGITEQAIDAVLEGAREAGAETGKIYLVERNIAFCKNCRTCSWQTGVTPGHCVQHDDMESVLREVEEANAVVLGSPVNYYNVTAVFRKFMERLLGFCAYWPWGANHGPHLRTRAFHRNAVLVCSAGMPGLMIPFATSAPGALRLAAKMLGADPVGKLWIGRAALSPDQQLPPRTRAKAIGLGRKLV